MKQSIFTIVSNTALTDCVYKMTLRGDTSAITAPGQFVNIKLEGLFLRRPISVYDYAEMHGTIPHEVMCNIAMRVPRVYYRHGKLESVTDYLLP